MPLVAGMSAAQILAKRWSDHPRTLVGTGLALIGLGLLGASTASGSTPYGLFVCWLLVISTGAGLSMPPLTLGVVTSLPAHQAGLGSGLGTTARETGAALGVAVTGTVLSGHADLIQGMRPALRVVGVVVLVATGVVVRGYGRRETLTARPTPAATP